MIKSIVTPVSSIPPAIDEEFWRQIVGIGRMLSRSPVSHVPVFFAWTCVESQDPPLFAAPQTERLERHMISFYYDSEAQRNFWENTLLTFLDAYDTDLYGLWLPLDGQKKLATSRDKISFYCGVGIKGSEGNKEMKFFERIVCPETKDVGILEEDPKGFVETRDTISKIFLTNLLGDSTEARRAYSPQTGDKAQAKLRLEALGFEREVVPTL